LWTALSSDNSLSSLRSGSIHREGVTTLIRMELKHMEAENVFCCEDHISVLCESQTASKARISR
jgi:hypothetical protein